MALPELGLTKGELLQIVQDAAMNLWRDWQDDHKISAGEIVEFFGEICASAQGKVNPEWFNPFMGAAVFLKGVAGLLGEPQE